MRYVKQTGIINQLTKTVRQMSDTRFSTLFLTLDSIKEVYTELREKVDNRGESRRINKVSPDVLEFLLDFLRPFYQAQKELEGDQYPTLYLVVLWHEWLKHHCRPLCFPPSRSATAGTQANQGTTAQADSNSLHLEEPTVGVGVIPAAESSPVAYPLETGPSLSSERRDMASTGRVMS